jgi:hypothetical protein
MVTDLAAIEVLLGTIDTDTSALAGAVDGTEVQVDIVSSALPTGAATDPRAQRMRQQLASGTPACGEAGLHGRESGLPEAPLWRVQRDFASKQHRQIKVFLPEYKWKIFLAAQIKPWMP